MKRTVWVASFAAMAVLATSCMRWQPVRTDVAPSRALGPVRVLLTSGKIFHFSEAAFSGDSIVGDIPGAFSNEDRRAGRARRTLPMSEVRIVQAGEVSWIRTLLLGGAIVVVGFFALVMLSGGFVIERTDE